MSTAFAAIVQTIKNDPQMVKLIQNMPSANDGEQHKDNDNNNITQYIESNKDSLLDLAEKHYENLVEALTNNTIDTAFASSNLTSSLPKSLSIFPNLSNQSHIYRKEESENYHNDKDDIAE